MQNPLPVCHTLVISDCHLGPQLERRVFWIVRAIRRALYQAQAHGAQLTVAMAGDVWEIDGHADGVDVRNENGAARTMARLLVANAPVLQAIREVLAAGHTVIMLPGNHDAQLSFPTIRHQIVRMLGPGDIRFRAWFHRTPDGVHVEHGHLYDPLCCLDRPYPVLKAGSLRLEDTVGGIATRHSLAVLPGADPTAVDPLASADLRDARLTPALIVAVRETLCLNALNANAASAAEARFLSAVAQETDTPFLAVVRHHNLRARKATLPDLVGMACPNPNTPGYGEITIARLRTAQKSIPSIYPGTQLVVMGHTHASFCEPGAANSGTWTEQGSTCLRVMSIPGQPLRAAVERFP